MTGYGQSVLARSEMNPPGDWDQRVRLYSDGLLRGDWTPSFPALRERDGPSVKEPLQDSSSRHSGKYDDDWQFHCPVSIIFGLQDVALDPSVVLDGIERHFLNESDDPLISSAMAEDRITRIRSCGHWSLLEDEGSEALDRVLARIFV